MSRNYSTEAIVLGSHKFGEADRVVTLFTAARGKVPTVVKGVRKVKSKFGGRLEPFTHLQVQLHEGRNLHTLTGADTVRTHASLRDGPSSLQAGLAFIDMLGSITTDFERRPRSFNLLVRYLDEMDAAGRNFPGSRYDQEEYALEMAFAQKSLVLGAELKLLLLAGFLPHLANCAVCGIEGAHSRFSAQAGGAICENCGGESFRISAGALEIMRNLLEKPLAKAPGLKIDASTGNEIWKAIREICRYHIGINLKVKPW